jgi:hypothetical protein
MTDRPAPTNRTPHRCPACGIPNGWHASDCASGRLTDAEVREVREHMRAGLSACDAALSRRARVLLEEEDGR